MFVASLGAVRSCSSGCKMNIRKKSNEKKKKCTSHFYLWPKLCSSWFEPTVMTKLGSTIEWWLWWSSDAVMWLVKKEI